MAKAETYLFFKHCLPTKYAAFKSGEARISLRKFGLAQGSTDDSEVYESEGASSSDHDGFAFMKPFERLSRKFTSRLEKKQSKSKIDSLLNMGGGDSNDLFGDQKVVEVYDVIIKGKTRL